MASSRKYALSKSFHDKGSKSVISSQKVNPNVVRKFDETKYEIKFSFTKPSRSTKKSFDISSILADKRRNLEDYDENQIYVPETKIRDQPKPDKFFDEIQNSISDQRSRVRELKKSREKFDELVNSEYRKDIVDYETKSFIQEKDNHYHGKYPDDKVEKYENTTNEDFVKNIANKYQNKNHSEAKDYKSKYKYSHNDNNEDANEYKINLRDHKNFQKESVSESIDRRPKNKVFSSNKKSKFLYVQMRIKEEEDILGKKIDVLKKQVRQIKLSDNYHYYDQENFDTIFKYYDEMISLSKDLNRVVDDTLENHL